MHEVRKLVTYIYKRKEWPHFRWEQEKIADLLATVRHRQGRLLGRMEALGFHLQEEAVLATLTQDVLKSSEIEGEILDHDQVRSSIARRLGLEIPGVVPSERHVDGVVEMMLDATQSFRKDLTEKRLKSWHGALFPTGMSGMHKIDVGMWRRDKKGPMQVVSGPIGREKVHYEAPAAAQLNKEIKKFIIWVKHEDGTDPVLRAALAHLWFVTIHPFDDGNGRIARAVADWALARSENSAQRFYSMSSQIRIERKAYYDVLEKTQKGDLDITAWIKWFLECLNRAFDGTEIILSSVLRKEQFWKTHEAASMNDRQKLMVNKLLDGFKGKLTSSKWATLAKCSQDTAHRDIQDLIKKLILEKDAGGGRSTSYSLK